MRDTDLYRQLLGLEKPWTVNRVELDVNKQRVDVFSKHEKPKSRTCPEYGKPFGVHNDDEERASGVISTAAASRRFCMLGFRA